MRLLVHEPMNTRSIGIAAIGVPLSSPMYSSAREALDRSLGSFIEAGSGTVASTPTTWAGFVPQVTCGTTSPPENVSLRS